jgi:hypothetical protein
MLASLAVLLLVADPALAPATVQKPKLICRESEQELGSHIRTGRRCKTAEEWRQEDLRRDQISPTMRVTAGQGDALTPKTRPQ